MPRNRTSVISRKARPVPVESGELFGSVYSSDSTRKTETDGITRVAYGEQIAATNNARYDAQCILCSVCGNKKHYLDFNRDSRMKWRFSRRYECNRCEKLQKVDQSARRKKRLARSSPVRSA